MISVKEILQGLKTEALTVCDTVYTQERPTAADTKLTSFVVVSLPIALHEEVMCVVLDWWVHTIVQFEIYVKDRATNANPNQMNIPATDTLVQGILNLFSFNISGAEHTYHVSSPEVLYVGRTDDNGYHRTLIQATLATI